MIIDVKNYASAEELKIYEVSGFDYPDLNKRALDAFKFDFYLLEEVFFLRDNEIQTGSIREIKADLVTNIDEIKVDITYIIFNEEGEMIKYPGDVEKITKNKEELLS